MALPLSGELSIKAAASIPRSIANEVDGNLTGDKSLRSLSVTAGKSAPHSMLEFYGYSSVSNSISVNPNNIAFFDVDYTDRTIEYTIEPSSATPIISVLFNANWIVINNHVTSTNRFDVSVTNNPFPESRIGSIKVEHPDDSSVVAYVNVTQAGSGGLGGFDGPGRL